MSQDEEGSIKACMTCGHLKPVHKEDGTICFGVVDSAQCSCRQYIERYVSIFYPELGKPDPLKEIIEERRKIYGDPYLSHQAIGLAWEGVVRNRFHELAKFLNESQIHELFPADLVADMLATFKIVRLARPVYHQDSADDAHNYIKFDEEFRGGKKE